MRQAKGVSVQNERTVRLLLHLTARKGELITARWEPGMRTKTGQPLDFLLATMAVQWLQKLKEVDCNAPHVQPARKLQSRRCRMPASRLWA